MFKRSIHILTILAVFAAALAFAPTASAGPESCDTRVNNTFKKLLECVTLNGVRAHQAAFQAIADANGGIRASGTPGYDASADYVINQLTSYGYNVTTQEFQFDYFQELSLAEFEQTAPGAVTYTYNVDFLTMDYSGSGDVTAPVTAVDIVLAMPRAPVTSGCQASDFAGFPAGHIALVQRGTCTFALKAINAEAAGAVGVIIFNQGNTPGREPLFGGTLGGVAVSIPVVSTSFGLGETLATTPGLTMRIKTDTISETRTTRNILAESVSGDPNNVVMAGAHLDSVNEGPGINDNGSGSAAILEVAKQMAKVNPRNKVRFAWWGAEESGLLGSEFYVGNLSNEELARITLYLNFDMVGSPNHVFFIYDGDDSDAEGSPAGPGGSAEIEKTFERYFNSVGVPFKGTDFSGRSDYGPFIAVGIPSGGLFTGAEGVKTAQEAIDFGGTAGVAYDPCYHQACDTFANNNNYALDVNSDAIAYSVLQYAMNTADVNGQKGKGNFQLVPGDSGQHSE